GCASMRNIIIVIQHVCMRSRYGRLKLWECLVLVPTIVGLLRWKLKHVITKKSRKAVNPPALFCG
ncbi:MAG: hypothetical protein ACXVBJ_01405, partial [Flavisolibacter sp.]